MAATGQMFFAGGLFISVPVSPPLHVCLYVSDRLGSCNHTQSTHRDRLPSFQDVFWRELVDDLFPIVNLSLQSPVAQRLVLQDMRSLNTEVHVVQKRRRNIKFHLTHLLSIVGECDCVSIHVSR